MPWMHAPSHWPIWLHTTEQTALMGLLANSTSPASSILRSRNSSMTYGMGVCTGQPLSWHIARLHIRQRLDSSTICTPILLPLPCVVIRATPRALRPMDLARHFDASQQKSP